MSDLLMSWGLFVPVVVLLLVALVVWAPLYVLVICLQKRRARRERERIRSEMEGKTYPRVTRGKKKPKGKLKHLEANTMPLGLNKLVRTGSPHDKGVMG